MTSGANGEIAKQTLASSIYGQLRDEILTGGIDPDSRLNIRELCGRFSVGLSPMREALSRLSAEGLVQQSDNRGFSVMPVSVAELLDLTQARCWVNEIGLRRSIEANDPAWEEAVLLSFHRAFHRALVEACGSPWLIETCERLFDAAERYRHLARIAGVSRGSLEGEHRAIMEAAIERKADQSVELLNLHFRRTADLVQQMLGASRSPATNRTMALQSTRD